MKVISVHILDDLEEIDIENDNIDVAIEADDDFRYILSFTTPKHLQFLMDKEKIDYVSPVYPFFIVDKLTPEIIEEAVKYLVEDKDGIYWFKIFSLGGWYGAIEKTTFNQLRAQIIEKRKEFGFD